MTLDDPDAAEVLRDQRPRAGILPLARDAGRLPPAAARNAGGRRALDAVADLLVFLDVDCVPGPTLLPRYAETARDGALLCGAPAHHQHHPVSRPPVEHLDDILRNGAVYHDRWVTWPMEGWLRECARLGLVRHDPVSGDWNRCAPQPTGPSR
ncbi:glycosyltransferase family 2 protein [Streptomyces sp. NPDC057020]|uniref:glycosyltransferase family 2 protein n=1 Tax=unclassified Streptomyces TaxID=2593676 RepID=UPI00363D26DB